MKTPTALALCAAIVLSAPLGALAQPAGNKTEEADARFRRGVELYNEVDYGAALTEFRRAYELAPAYQVLYNIAGTCYQLKDYACALRAFEKYLADGGQQIPGGRRAEVERDLAVLRGRVATVEISTSAPGVEISVDGVPAGETPLSEPLLMSAGRRRIVAEAPGRPALLRVVDVAGGDHVQLKIELPEARASQGPGEGAGGAPAPPGAVRPAPPGALLMDDRAPRQQRSVPLFPWLATGALAVGAAATGVLALGASGDLDAELDRYPGDARAIERARARSEALALTTDLLAGAAVLAGGLSIYLTVAGAGPERADAERASSPPVSLKIAPASLELAGSF
ncbi:PEGA domain-containing protein [Sorangium atrum]|uniref:PEGA domain-containing protein n=1 Tax=Sorangium atrum TaxID=2995308 RepID=A0ABT5C263_9BACT|nr:PEGA domain-containing protein [Sorangium aterium]MDC0680427.1 PEGA domain-containing protein [Sorangium aterium]